ncbi:hypothetical protein HJFPF1_00035 [Paramyrothecium foliicola]|nr:hypothetical protein HJFPF1_00035 [Paramyrothecium foliicola]
MLELPKSRTLAVLESAWALWHFFLRLFFGTGLKAVSSTPQAIFIRTSAMDDSMIPNTDSSNLDATKTDNIPDIEIMLQPVNSLERGGAGRHFFIFFPTLLRPNSTGLIELPNKNPLNPMAHPRIMHPFLHDDRDLGPIRRDVRFAMRLADDFQSSGFPYPAPLAFAHGMDEQVLKEWESAPAVLPRGMIFAVDGATATEGPVEGSIAKTIANEPAAKTRGNVTDDEQTMRLITMCGELQRPQCMGPQLAALPRMTMTLGS